MVMGIYQVYSNFCGVWLVFLGFVEFNVWEVFLGQIQIDYGGCDVCQLVVVIQSQVVVVFMLEFIEFLFIIVCYLVCCSDVDWFVDGFDFVFIFELVYYYVELEYVNSFYDQVVVMKWLEYLYCVFF